MANTDLSSKIAEFQQSYDAAAKDGVWREQSQKFRDFWHSRVLSGLSDAIPDSECDPIIRILDRNGKGNTRESEAVAKALVPQGAWRRLLNEFHTNKELASLMTKVFEESDEAKKARLINQLYEKNKGQGNSLTGPSGNTVNAFLAAYDPINNHYCPVNVRSVFCNLLMG